MSKLKDVIQYLMVSGNGDLAFFGQIVMLLDLEENKNIPTLGIKFGSKRLALIYNPDFLEGLSYEAIQYLITHEVSHIAYNHYIREKEFADLNIPHDIHNIAMDLAVNSLLTKPNDFNLGIYPDKLNLPDRMSYEEYLKELMKKEITIKMKGPSSGEGGGSNINKAIGEVLSNGRKLGEAHINHPTQVQADNMALQKMHKQIVDMANRMKGNISDSLFDEITASTMHRVNWKIRVKSSLNNVFKDFRWTPNYYKQNRRYPNMIGIIPGKRYKTKGKLLVFFDTSGSMSNSDLKKSLSYCLSLPFNKEIYMVDCDVQNYKPIKISAHSSTISLRMKGRGGTDFRPSFELAKKKKAVSVVYFTDLYGDFPEKDPGMDVIWACVTDNYSEPPFGRVIKI